MENDKINLSSLFLPCLPFTCPNTVEWSATAFFCWAGRHDTNALSVFFFFFRSPSHKKGSAPAAPFAILCRRRPVFNYRPSSTPPAISRAVSQTPHSAAETPDLAWPSTLSAVTAQYSNWNISKNDDESAAVTPLPSYRDIEPQNEGQRAEGKIDRICSMTVWLDEFQAWRCLRRGHFSPPPIRQCNRDCHSIWNRPVSRVLASFWGRCHTLRDCVLRIVVCLLLNSVK